MLAQYCKLKSINTANIMKPEFQNAVMRKYGFRDLGIFVSAADRDTED